VDQALRSVHRWSFFRCGQTCSVSVPPLDHIGKLLSLGRYKGLWSTRRQGSGRAPTGRAILYESKPRGGEVTVLAGGTSAEELIEGLSIGVGATINPGLALLIALASIIDNLAESLSIGEIIRSERRGA
jgi:ZIP family zinc transporter